MATPGTAGPAPEQWRGLRREPQQERSRARVRRLLEAADQVLAAGGYEALTVRRIAEEAGVPVGTIYQFFPDKSAIVDALAHRYIDEFTAVIEDLVARAEAEPWADPVGTLLTAFVDVYRSRPGYLAIWTGRHLSPELQRVDDRNNATIAAGVRRVMIVQLGLADGPDLDLACQVAVQVCDALLQYAFRTGPGGDDRVLAELTRLEKLYLADLVERLGGPAARAGAAEPAGSEQP
jgi:AcrR family transcriptional regulator